MIAELSSASDPYRAKYEKLGSARLVTQLRQNEELPKGILFSADVPAVGHPIWLRAGTSDLWVFDQIFLYDELNADFGKDMSFIIDAGANIGLASVCISQIVFRMPRSWPWRSIGTISSC